MSAMGSLSERAPPSATLSPSLISETASPTVISLLEKLLTAINDSFAVISIVEQHKNS